MPNNTDMETNVQQNRIPNNNNERGATITTLRLSDKQSDRAATNCDRVCAPIFIWILHSRLF